MTAQNIVSGCLYYLVKDLFKGTVILLFEYGPGFFMFAEIRGVIKGKTTMWIEFGF